MSGKIINILSTALLDDDIMSEADSGKVKIDAHAFIDIDAVTSQLERIKELSQLEITAVFTSNNAARVLDLALHGQKPAWKVYCIEGATCRRVSRWLGEECIAGTGTDSAVLAQSIISAQESSITFFCGDQRRPDLPEQLSAAGIAIEEITVYKTILTPVTIIKEYDAILFYSPTGVESFFMKNTLEASTVLFAIGNTTAAAIRERCSNKVVVGAYPDKALLVKSAYDYFGL